MTDGNVFQIWEDYRIYFSVGDVRTAKKRLARALGMKKVPKDWKGKGSAPMHRRETLDRIIDGNLSPSL